MIKLTRLGGEPFVLNADLIRYVESRPDTFITLTGGERLVVAESLDEVIRRAVAYQQAKHLMPAPKQRPDKQTERPPAEMIPLATRRGQMPETRVSPAAQTGESS